jgi:WhiB family transcriptional regulator, redox-sensing transcriptional regulator
VRQIVLLDAGDGSGSGGWAAGATVDRDQERRSFDQVVTSLLPCRAHDPELWFAEQTARVEQAKALCRECPVMAQCLAGAIEREEPWGVWGGEVFIGGVVVPTKRGRGRPRKEASPAA